MNPVNIGGGPNDARNESGRSGFNQGGGFSQPGEGMQKGSTPQGGVKHSVISDPLKAHSPLQTGAGSVTEHQQKSPFLKKGSHMQS